jgi:hypothetical protein
MPAEDISNNLEDLGFVINVRQMMTTWRASDEKTHVDPLPLFFYTLTRNIKPQETFQLNSPNYIIIKVESCRAQTGLTQCYNCQNFGHVWATCKQPPWCLLCGGGHLHRECPEKTNTEPMPSCCNCTLVEGQKPHPASYHGCSHVKGELQRRRAHWAPKGSSGRMIFSKFTSPEQSFTAALHQDTKHQQPWEKLADPYAPASATTGNSENTSVSTDPSSSNNDMLKVANIVQQIMTQLSEGASEKDKLMVITRMVLNLMIQNGC